MLATFESECPLCPYPLERGQSIIQDMDSDQWAHAACVARVERRDAQRVTCPECFILKPCECDA